MANKGKKKQKKPLRSLHHQERIQQTQQHQKARDLKYQVQESLEQCFVDWEELPEAEQQEILCYVTVGTFTRLGLSRCTETLGVRILVSSTKSEEDLESF